MSKVISHGGRIPIMENGKALTYPASYIPPAPPAPTARPQVELTVNDDALEFRSNFGERDIIVYCQKYGSNNKSFTFNSIYTTTASDNSTQHGDKFKGATDDINPVRFNGLASKGANHGESRAYSITVNDGHGLDETAIGQVWQDANGYDVLIIRTDSDTQFMVVQPVENPESDLPALYERTLTSPLTKDDITINFDSAQKTALHEILNHISVEVFDGGRKIAENGVYTSEAFDVVEEYDIIYTPAMVDYLIENAPNNTNDSYHSDDISEAYCRVINRFHFTERGAITQYQRIDWHRPVAFEFVAMAQSEQSYDVASQINAGDSVKRYFSFPGTVYDDVHLLDEVSGSGVYLPPDEWRDADNPPSRYYQYAENLVCGMCVGCNTEYGNGVPDYRKDKLLRAVELSKTNGKLYPRYITVDVGSSATPGTNGNAGVRGWTEPIRGISYRVPLTEYDEELPSVGWYYINDDIYLLIDSHSAVSKKIALPDYMVGRSAEIVDGYGTISTGGEVENDGLSISTGSYGSAVIRLTNSSKA